ncbi:hypothetical protein ABTH13_19610, partial [Acinetobacter baumannii]
MTIQDIQSLAEAHGLLLTDKMNFNEMGIDFKVVFALDTKGQQWLLRIPRRDGMREGTVAKLAMRQPFVLFKGLTFQKLCLP